jgi:hypothetical protein
MASSHLLPCLVLGHCGAGLPIRWQIGIAEWRNLATEALDDPFEVAVPFTGHDDECLSFPVVRVGVHFRSIKEVVHNLHHVLHADCHASRLVSGNGDYWSLFNHMVYVVERQSKSGSHSHEGQMKVLRTTQRGSGFSGGEVITNLN